MTAAPLFDLHLRTLRRRRAQAMGFADFLHREAAGLVQERLRDVNRTFTRAVLIGGFAPAWREEAPGLTDADLVADDDVLDFPGRNYDLAVHALGLHAANDPVGQIIQARRVLVPDGLFIGVTLGGASLHELRTSLLVAEAGSRGGAAPRVAPMGDIRDLGALLQRAGLALPVADADRIEVSYADLRALMADLRAMGETNILAAREKRFAPRALFERAGAVYSERFAGPDGRLRATFELIFLTGWAPAAHQQQPLRPGSAKARLADALGTTEFSAREKAGRS